jgi:hypothetical protein
VDAFGCGLEVDGVSPIDPHCPFCLSTGYVCEEHPNLAWGDMVSDPSDPQPGACYCGAPGMPCWEGRKHLASLDGPAPKKKP